MLFEKQQGALPSTTESNPREHVNTITLHSVEANSKVKEARQKLKPIPVKEYQPKIPYPARLKQVEAQEQFSKFLDIFRQLHINLPFVNVLKQMPKYAKFLKDILSSKRKLEKSKLPEKRHDPGSFAIPCTLGNLCVNDALVDLGTSINVMPTSMFNKLGLGEAKPTRMCIQLANHFVKLPKGIVENVLVKVDKFIFPVDFMVMDMDNEHIVPLILGRPFLATARAKIDVFEGKLELNVGDDYLPQDILIDDALHVSLPVHVSYSFEENNLYQFETSCYDTPEKGSCKFVYDRSSRQDLEWMNGHPNSVWRAPSWPSTAHIGPPL
ncbi:uncharacterized protein LOC125369924 [Ricinus communis]|uniref:uncharacterized protein LOC125369924 n=1 Tax=Ricinus communis TaxID=3988 RepID=UPI00201A2ACE|nr:uncharacterized protein LOC125369924 [Ricinus communis]